MKELLAFLDSIYPLSQSARNYLIQNLKEIEIPKKKFLLKKGRVCHNIYFVEKGLLGFNTKNDKDVNSWFMKEQDVIFSVESFLNQTPSHESIQVLDDSRPLLYYLRRIAIFIQALP